MLKVVGIAIRLRLISLASNKQKKSRDQKSRLRILKSIGLINKPTSSS
jgi:hypothetical protein